MIREAASRANDIDQLVDRTLLYAGLSVGVAGSYIAVVTGLGAVFGGDGLGISLIAAGAVAAIVMPLHAELQRRVGRLMRRDRNDPYRALVDLGERIEAALEPDAVMPAIVATVTECLRLPYAAIELLEDDGRRVAARHGDPPGTELIRLPLAHRGERLGSLVVAARSPGDGLAARDRRLLADLARHAGVAVQSVRLAHGLRRSREQLVAAREEERRGLRRELHDGLGPALAGVALELESTVEQIDADPDGVSERLGRAGDEVRALLDEIRRIARELQPVEGG